MQYVISFVASIACLALGNWISLPLYFPVLSVLAKVSPRNATGAKWGILSLHISRACMGITVSLLYYIPEYFGALRLVMTATFGVWALLLSEPFSEVQAHDLCRGDLQAYQQLRWRLKTTRIVFYFLPVFLLLAIAYVLYG